jgi:hypothetical protein
VIQRQIPLEHAAPLLVSGVSGCYILARARQLAMANATQASLSRFLLGQSDVIFVLLGGPAIWYVAERRRRQHPPELAHSEARGSTARAVHQLRQVFTALLLGTELLARKASAGKTSDLGKLARRLNRIVRDGLVALAALGEPYPADLIDEHGSPIRESLSGNGTPS